MAKVMIQILHGSAVTQIVLGDSHVCSLASERAVNWDCHALRLNAQLHTNSATARLSCISYISDHSNAEIIQYADFHGRDSKPKIMHTTKI